MKASKFSTSEMLRGDVMLVSAIALFVLISSGCDGSKQNEMERAQQFRAKREYSAAIIELKSILQQDLNNANVRLLLGNTYLDVEDGASSEKELRKAKSLGISDNEVVPGLARALLLQKSYDAVLKLELEDARAPLPMAELEASRALAYLELGHQDKARAHLSGARSSAPESGWVRYVQARLLIAEKSRAEAKAVLVKLVGDEPHNGIAWSLLGYMYQTEGEMAEAEQAFTRAIAHRTDVNSDHYRRGHARLSQGKLEAASQDADVLLRRTPEWAQAAYFAGRVRFLQKRYAEAADALEKAYQQDFNNRQVALLLARTYLALDKPERAQELAEQALQSRPTSLFAKKLLAEALLQQKKGSEAEKLLRTITVARPHEIQPRIALAQSLSQQGKDNEAIKLLERILASAPENNEVRAALAHLYMSRNEAQRALVMLEESPNKDNKILLLQANAYLHLKQFSNAKRVLERVRDSAPESTQVHLSLAHVYAALGDRNAAQASLFTAHKLKRDREDQQPSTSP